MLLLTAALALPAGAQDEMPAVGGDAPARPSVVSAPQAGTTIIGERESPIGLYITPWRDAQAEDDIDRPARLLQETLRPIDETVFLRQVEYHRALSGALRAKGKVTPDNR
ncbi:MAG TPA: hypothetical protein VGE57_04165 [Solimonas sp.]